jgi:hypothetical protein
MTNLQNTLFAVALTALTGSALAATPPPAAASPTAAAKTTVTKHKHFVKAKKEDAKDQEGRQRRRQELNQSPNPTGGCGPDTPPEFFGGVSFSELGS